MVTAYDFTTDLADLIDPTGPWVPSGEQAAQEDAEAGIILDTTDDEAVVYKTAAGADAAGSIALLVDGTNLGDTGIIQIDVTFTHAESPIGGIGLMMSRNAKYTAVFHHWYKEQIWRDINGSITQAIGLNDLWWAQPGTHTLRFVFTSSTTYHLWHITPAGVPVDLWGELPLYTVYRGANLLITIGFLHTQDDSGYFGAGQAVDAAGEAQLLSCTIYSDGDSVPADISTSTTLATAVTKYNTLAAGTATTLIITHAAAIAARVQEADQPAAVSGFPVICWQSDLLPLLPDYNGNGFDAALLEQAAERFSHLQIRHNLENDSSSVPTTSEALIDTDLLAAADLELSVYFYKNWGSYIRSALSADGSYELPYSYSTYGTRWPMHGDMVEHAVTHGLHNIERFLHAYPGVPAMFMIDSERHPAPAALLLLLSATAGTYTLTYEGQTTDAIAWNASAYTIRTELEKLSNITAGSGTYLYGETEGDIYAKGVYPRYEIVHHTDLDFTLTVDYTLLTGWALVFPNHIVQQLASDAGLTELHLRMPTRGPHVWADGARPNSYVFEADDARWLSVDWSWQRRTHDIHYSILASQATALWPEVQLVADSPLWDYFRTEYGDAFGVLQIWHPVTTADTEVYDLCWFLERGWVHNRKATSNVSRVFIGPQLYSVDLTRGIPADMLTTACWLCVAWGCQGIMHWGISCLYNIATSTWYPNGEAAWDALATLKSDLYDEHSLLLSSWEPAPRRVAVLCAFSDYVTGRGGSYSHDTELDLSQNYHKSIRWAHAAMILAGEPCDVVYEEEVTAGDLSDYEVLIVPSLATTSRALVTAIQTFATGGGKVLCHSDAAGPLSNGAACALVAEGVTDMEVLDGDYWNDPVTGDPSSSLDPPCSKTEVDDGEGLAAPAKKTFLLALGADIISRLGITPRINFAIPGQAVGNVMRKGNRDYLVLVNDNRSCGAECDFWGKDYMLDQSTAVTVKLDYKRAVALVDETDGQIIRRSGNKFKVTLPAAGGRIFRVVLPGGVAGAWQKLEDRDADVALAVALLLEGAI